MNDTVLNIKISRMMTADVDDVIAIEEKAYGEHHWSKDSFLSEINNELARYYCARDENNNLVGYAGCWQILEEAHITNIAVSPDMRRKHIGNDRRHATFGIHSAAGKSQNGFFDV